MKKIKSFSVIMIAALLLISMTAVFNIVERKADYTYTSNSVLVTNIGKSAGNALEARRVVEQLDIGASADELVMLREDNSATGKTYRFQQYYGGYPVFGRQAVVSVNERGEVSTVNGNIKDIENLDLKYDRERFESEIQASKYSLTIYSLDDTNVLCFEYCNGRNRIFVNARTMQQVACLPLNANNSTSNEQVTFSNEQVMLPQALPDGSQVMLPIERNTESGLYYLSDDIRNISVNDLENRTEITANLITSPDGKFNDSSAVILYSNVIKAYDFYADGDNIGIVGGYLGADGKNDAVHGNAVENKESSIILYVHYDVNHDNAYLVSSSEPYKIELVFGDGSGINKPFQYALDIVAHEYQHAIVKNLAGLINMNEPGALNEAIADIFGALVEGYPMSDDRFWLIGEDVYLDGGATRDIKNPAAYNNPVEVNGKYWHSLCHDNDSHYYCDNGGLHTNATIISHLAYRMYAANPEFFTEKETGRLWFHTLQKMTPTSNFEDFRMLMEQSAAELGYDESARNVIATAFNAANIIASDGEHTVQIDCDGERYSLKGNYGDEFVMPDYQCSKTGYFINYWYESKYGARYFAGETYAFPAYDIVLLPKLCPKMWNDCALTQFEQTGEIDDPYIVRNAADLASLAYYSNTAQNSEEYKYVELVADIDLLGVPWVPIGTKESGAYYVFNGNGHKIYNLVIDDSYDLDCLGLFGMSYGSITNLGIESGRVVAAASVMGSIVGYTQDEVTNCYNKATVINTFTHNTASDTEPVVGGVVGSSLSDAISGCYNLGEVSGEFIVGGVVGRIVGALYDDADGMIACCIAFGNNYNTGELHGAIVGGIVGSAPNSTIVNCINTGKVVADVGESASRLSGGIVGRLNYIDIGLINGENAALLGCKNTGAVEAEGGTRGGLVGLLANSGTTGNTLVKNNVYKVRGELAAFGVGADAVGVMGDAPKQSTDEVFTGDFDFDNAEYYADKSRWCFAANVSIFDAAQWIFEENKMPVHRDVEYWVDFAADSFDGGDGTESAPFQIRTAAQLARLAYVVNNLEGKYKYANYELTADIDLKGKIWVSIGGESVVQESYGSVGINSMFFSGNFEGNGHTISNMSARSVVRFVQSLDNEWYRLTTGAALFGGLSSNVKNVKLANVNNVSKFNAAGIVAEVHGASVISGCEVDGVILSLDNAGGIVGQFLSHYSSLTVLDCYNRATVSGDYAGGMVGRSIRPMDDPYQTSAEYNLTVKNCINTGNINVNFYESCNKLTAGGGIVGYSATHTTIDSCISDGVVASFAYINVLGGIIGIAEGDKANMPELEIKLLYCKMSGEFINYGQTLIDSPTVGMFMGEEYTVNLILQGCATTKDYLFSDANKNGIVTTLSVNDCIESAADSSFDYNNIDYYFDRNFWGQVDSERANAMYEFYGNAPIRFTVTFINADGTTYYSQTVKYGEVPTAPDGTPEKQSTSEFEYTFKGWGTLEAVTSDMSYTAQFTESVIPVKLGLNTTVILLSMSIPIIVLVVAAIATFIILQVRNKKSTED